MKRRERYMHTIIIDLLPSLPMPFSRQTVLDHWPQDMDLPTAERLSDTLRSLYRCRVIQIASGSRSNRMLYEAIPMPEPPGLTEQERAWRQFKQENKIGEQAL